jgi:hypothetical protein
MENRLMKCMARMAVVLAGLSLFDQAIGPTHAEDATPLDTVSDAGETVLIAAPVATADGQGAGLSVLHYRLHLPADYHDGGEKSYPVMFIAAPGGHAEMGAMRAALERDRWIVAMMVESRNGSNIWTVNFTAAHADLMQRARVQKNMLFCTGMSGAAKVCSVYPQIRPGFQGMILQAAGPWGARTFYQPGNEDLLVYGTFGTHDPNFHHGRSIRLSLPDGVRRMVEIWEGGHDWAPEQVIERALDWTVAAALDDRDYSPDFDDAYEWRATNLLSEFEAESDPVGRTVKADKLRNALGKWRDALDGDLIARIEQAVSETDGSVADEEISAWRAWQAAFQADEAGRGKDMEATTAPYQRIVEEYPGTTYAEIAAQRLRVLHWETGQYP